jgi:hypothetical protein
VIPLWVASFWGMACFLIGLLLGFHSDNKRRGAPRWRIEGRLLVCSACGDKQPALSGLNTLCSCSFAQLWREQSQELDALIKEKS